MGSAWIVSGLVVAVLAGCGSSAKPPHAHLQGKVTLDNAPILQGTISFTPPHGEAIVVPIVDGQYSADVPLGPVHVLFQSTRETGRKVKMYDVEQPEVVNVIPLVYQAGVELVVADGQTLADFPLRSR